LIVLFKGIISAKVNLDDKLGIFEYDPSVTAPDLIKDYVDEMGFEASFKHAGSAKEKTANGKVLTGFVLSEFLEF
jgi:hypothetical protein